MGPRRGRVDGSGDSKRAGAVIARDPGRKAIGDVLQAGRAIAHDTRGNDARRTAGGGRRRAWTSPRLTEQPAPRIPLEAVDRPEPPGWIPRRADGPEPTTIESSL